MLRTMTVFTLAACAEIAGCFSFWLWLRSGRSAAWALPGVASLVIFGLLLTQVESDVAGRAFAAYGGIYICASLAWMWMIEGVRPDRWDVTGGALCLVGAAIILASHARPATGA